MSYPGKDGKGSAAPVGTSVDAEQPWSFPVPEVWSELPAGREIGLALAKLGTVQCIHTHITLSVSKHRDLTFLFVRGGVAATQ